MPNETEISSNNRRQELRFRGHCQRVTWQKAQSNPATALLCDFSASGASLMVSQRGNHSLQRGEQIALRGTSAKTRDQIYQIRRVEQMGPGYVLAGCSRSVDGEVKNDPIRSPRLSAAVSPPKVEQIRRTGLPTKMKPGPDTSHGNDPSFATGDRAA